MEQKRKKGTLDNCVLYASPTDISDITQKQLEEFLLCDDFSNGLNPAHGSLRKLKQLDLCSRGLKSLPERLGDLDALEELLLCDNDFSDGLNPVLGRLRKLRNLDLGSCHLKNVPDWLGDFEALEDLALPENNFSDGVNPGLRRLHKLKKLDLGSCSLGSVPDWLGDFDSLEDLVLRHNNFSDGLNPVLGRLRNLKKLDLQFCHLKSVPDWLGDLDSLEDLVLPYNKFSDGLNPSLGRLRNLKKLDLTYCKLKSVPDWLGDFDSLEDLRLEHSKFYDGLNPLLGRLRNLKKLDLTYCQLKSVPECLGDFDSLEDLVLRHNNFSDGLNPVLGRLRKLKKLNLTYCELKSVPDWVGDFDSLEELVLPCNNFSDGLNPVLGRLCNLKKLDLKYCRLKSAPDCLGDLDALEDLALENNDFSDGLNPSVGRLRKLKRLLLGSCSLNSVPDCLGDLDAVEDLVLASNNFSDGLNPSLGRLRNLKKLDLTYCKLKSVPDCLGDLDALSSLKLRDNCLEEYASCFHRMKNLEKLDVSNSTEPDENEGNRIKHLPVELAFTRLRSLRLDYNPLTEPPEEIWTQGLDAIRSYMRALIPGGELMRADTVNMIGDTGAGKTSIAQSLVARAPRPTAEDDRTRVMQQLRMRIDELSGQSVCINDFGGHEIYHSVMPIFLPANGLFVLALDMTDSSYELRIQKWLLTIIAKSGDIRIIIAGTHADQVANVEQRSAWEKQVVELSLKVFQSAVREVNTHVNRLKSRHEDKDVEHKLQRLHRLRSSLQRATVCVVTLSCFVHDEGLARLRDLTVELLHPQRVLPTSWCRVIMDMFKQSSDGLYITMVQVQDIAKSHLVSTDDEALTTLLRYLAKTSQILWIEDHPRLRNCIFLPPQNVINVCKRVLHHDNEVHDMFSYNEKALQEYEKGILQESLLRELLEAREEKIHIQEQDVPVCPTFEVMVDFLLKFNLVSHFNKKREGRRFVIPCKLPPNEPSKLEQFKQLGDTCLNRVTVRLSFIGAVVPLAFFETSLSSMLTVAGEKFIHSYVNPWKDGLIIVHDGVYFLTRLGDGGIILTGFSEPPAASPWTILQPVLRRLNDDAVGTWLGAPPSCAIECPWCARSRCQGDDPKSEVGEIEIDLSVLAALEWQDHVRPTCPKCIKAIPQSLCFPPLSFGSSTEEQRRIKEFFKRNDGDEDSTQCSELVRRLRKATPQLVRELDRHSVNFIVDELLAARDGYGLITDDQIEEIEAESTNNGKVRKLLRIIGTRGDEAIKTLAASLKCEGVRRPDLAELFL